MKNELLKFETLLNKLNLTDVNKFSSVDFKSINKDFEIQLNNFKKQIELDEKNNFTFDDQLKIKSIINKIEKLESKIIPKADLINSFSEYSV